MVYTKNLVLVCTGRDATPALQAGLPVLHLCLAISPRGMLCRMQLLGDTRKVLLGLRDLPDGLLRCDADEIAAGLVYEARRTEALGVFADFEHITPASRAVLRAADQALSEASIPLYVPFASRSAVSHAILTVDTAVSGGSLVERITQLQGTYGVHRIAAFLRPVSADFTMPSASAEGAPLSAQERLSLMERTGAQPFFSRELCAKYFTFTDESGQAHFVLFDDASTMQAKLAQLSGCGVSMVFALYPDAAAFLSSPS